MVAIHQNKEINYSIRYKYFVKILSRSQRTDIDRTTALMRLDFGKYAYEMCHSRK